ncbi:hypothetical protein BKA70DRAFT_1513950 [Coprinopsis sp. MPI-PUGE-AT-0042]|nr:hypothetical protein BKA70DRAFT_1513950 [Coprinopsis sp. MPI-PUGE-AT-0042]
MNAQAATSSTPPSSWLSPLPSTTKKPLQVQEGEQLEMIDVMMECSSKNPPILPCTVDWGTSAICPSAHSPERVAQYRGRSDSSASALSTASPSSPVNGHHPFPSVAGSPPSPSPPTAGAQRIPASRSSTLPPLSASVSTPVIEESKAAKNLSPTHVRTRSHSFTPKLPSKLAVHAYSAMPKKPAPSLKRGDSGDPEKPQAPWGFGFGFGNSSKDSNHSNPDSPVTGRFPGSPSVTSPGGQTSANNRGTVLLSPPIIIEPQEEETQQVEADTRRTSQILLHSGLINRLVDVPSTFQSLSNAKGWKPFKMELKGSKLYFYKPPSDRTNAIKELFPSGLVPPSEEEEEAEEEVVEVDGSGEGAGKARGREESGTGGGTRKKRAYWGRQGHPDLVLDANGKIVKGTFEALVHEAVFGTTFDMDASTSKLPLTWNEFASSILLGLLHLVDPLIFEAEFLRCCSFLVSGAEDSAKESDRSRVVWLANEYLRHHGKPADSSAWDTWKQDTLPDVDLSAEGGSSSSGMPTSASTQALHSTSPFSTPGAEFTTFSPRPENGGPKMVPLLAALNLPTSSASSAPYPSRVPWNAINEEGLTRDILVALDAQFIAKSLMLFHRLLLEQSPDNLTAELVLPSTEPSPKQPRTPFCSLFGTDDHPHWLTKLLLVQIFGVDTHGPPPPQQLQSPSRKSEDRSNPPPAASSTSRTHSRSEIISVWAKVGELCRRTGDECSWKAIAAALCSRPVARLDKAWRRVDPNALSVVEAWAYPTSKHKTLSVNDPRVTPWGGDLKVRLAEAIGKAKGEPGDLMMRVDALHRTRTMFEQFKGAFALCPRNSTISEDEATDDLKRMVAFWKEVADGGRTSGLAVKFQRVEQFLSLSLAAECRRKGLFEPLFWQRAQSSQPASNVLIPLLFPEPLPTQSLVDRTQLIRNRVESDAMDMHQQYLRTNGQTVPPPLQRLDFNPDFTKRLIFGQAGPVISVYNGELLLMVQPGSNGADSRPPSRVPSRPASSVNEAGSPESRPASRAPSIRVKPSSSTGDRHQ